MFKRFEIKIIIEFHFTLLVLFHAYREHVSHKYSGPKISLHSFENAAAAPLPFAVCLTAIFAKICGKTLNPGQTLFGSTVHALTLRKHAQRNLHGVIEVL